MADEAEQQVSEDTSVETTTADSQSEIETQDSNATSTEGAGESQDGKADEGQAESNASTGDKSKSGDQDSKQDSKPVSRRSAAYRINQLVGENRILKQQLGKPSQEQDEWEQPAQDDTQPNVAELVAKEVERRLNPIVSESSKAADDAEISELFGSNTADRAKYEGQLRSMWNLPQYKDVAAIDLYNMLRGKEMEQYLSQAQLAAVEDYKKAQKEAKESSASGTSNSNRTGKSGKSISDLSDEEFAQRNERIKAGLPI
jgi:hypothetical protein